MDLAANQSAPLADPVSGPGLQAGAAPDLPVGVQTDVQTVGGDSSLAMVAVLLTGITDLGQPPTPAAADVEFLNPLEVSLDGLSAEGGDGGPARSRRTRNLTPPTATGPGRRNRWSSS